MALPLKTAVGRQVQTLRKRYGRTAEDVAASARELGLDWTRSAVAQLENGRREITAAELLLLPRILSRTFERPVSLHELFPPEEMALSDTASLSGDGIVGILQGALYEPELAPPPPPEGIAEARKLWPSASTPRLTEAVRDASLEPEQKAAKKFGVSALAVSVAAHKTWGHGLSAEREARLTRQAGRKSPGGFGPGQRARATEVLLRELAPLVERIAQRERKGSK